MAQIPHVKFFPVRLAADGDVEIVEQGSADDVAQQVRTLVSTPKGWSDEPDLADMGITEQAFYRGGADVAEIEDQLARYVPEWQDEISDALDAFDEALSLVNIRVSRGA